MPDRVPPRLWPGEKIPVELGSRGLQCVDHAELCAEFSKNACTREQLEASPPGNRNPVHHGCKVCGSTAAGFYSVRGCSEDLSWWCVDCCVNEFVDHKGGSMYQPETRVLLHGLAGRAELNGREGVLLKPTQREEAELRERQRIKVRVGKDTLSVRLASVLLGKLAADPRAGTHQFSMRSTASAGLGMVSRAVFRQGDLVLVDHPLATVVANPMRWMDHPECGPLYRQALAQGHTHGHLEGAAASPPEVSTLIDQATGIRARDAFSRLSSETQSRWMALHDAFAEDENSVGGILRSNSFMVDIDGEMHEVLYERLSRANHSCSPNIAAAYHNGGSAYVFALREIKAGEELLVCYTPHEMTLPVQQRRESLDMKYRFVCMCERCARESS